MAPSSSAVDCSSPTALASANGVGANAVRPSSSNCGWVWSTASWASDGHVLRRRVEERGQRGRGVLRVAADLTVLERLQGDLLGAEVEVGGDVVAGGLERLCVDLAEDELLGEVLRADRQLARRCCPGSPAIRLSLLASRRVGFGRRPVVGCRRRRARSRRRAGSAVRGAPRRRVLLTHLVWVPPCCRPRPLRGLTTILCTCAGGGALKHESARRQQSAAGRRGSARR